MIRAVQRDRPVRLLIADDNRDFASNVADLARLHGFDARIVHSIAQANHATHETAFDVAFIDHRLPDGRGVDLIGRWRVESPDIVPIVSTAFASIDSTLAALNHGAFALVTKDSEPEVIVDALLRAAENAMLRRENRNLRDTQESILAALPDQLLLVDRKLNVHSANRRDPILCHQAPAPQLPCLLVDFFAPTVGDRVDWRHLLQDGNGADTREVSLTLRVEGDSTRSYGVRATRLKASSEGLFLVQLVDVTDRVDLVRRLSESEGLATLGRLVAIIAHELRNPITGVRALAQMLKKTLGPAHADAESVDEILALTGRMSTTLADILAYSRPREWKEEPVDLCELVSRIVRDGRRWPASEGRTLELDVAENPGAIMVRGERERLYSAVSNLAENALHACEEGGKVRVRLRSDATNAWITVEDTGPGIPEAQVKRVFDPFFSTKKGGTGLGLPIVKTIVDRHGGTIDIARSEDLGGAAITIRLPLACSGEPTS